MGDSKENFSKKRSNRGRRFATGKGRSYFKRHRVAGWEANSLEPTPVDPNDDDTLHYIASKVYNEIRKLKSKPGKTFADFGSIYYSLYWIAEAGNLILFKDVQGRKVGVLAFEIVTPWYTRFTCLDEIFVLGLDPSFYGFGRVALDFMKKTAKEIGCALMQTGASMTDNPKMIENLYKRHGHCAFSYPSFAWVFPN